MKKKEKKEGKEEKKGGGKRKVKLSHLCHVGLIKTVAVNS